MITTLTTYCIATLLIDPKISQGPRVTSHVIVYYNDIYSQTLLKGLLVSMAKHVLVSGGAGYIGSHTVVELLNSDEYEPIVVDNLYNASRECIARIEKLTGKKVSSI